MDDGDIVALYWARSESAIKESAAKYGRYCYAIAYNILSSPEDAEESVNDAWMAAWNSIPPHRPATLSTFLGKLARRAALRRRREQSAEKRGGGETALALDELEECIPAEGSIDDALSEAELAAAVDAFLGRLPDAERRVFVCRYWYLDPVAEIGRRFGFSESKVKSMLLRTRKKLFAYLKKEGVFE